MTLQLADAGVTGLANVGSGIATTWIDLVTPIFVALDRPPVIEFVDMPETLKSKYQYYTRADMGAAGPLHGGTSEVARAVADYVSRYLRPLRSLDPLIDSSLSY